MLGFFRVPPGFAPPVSRRRGARLCPVLREPGAFKKREGAESAPRASPAYSFIIAARGPARLSEIFTLAVVSAHINHMSGHIPVRLDSPGPRRKG